MDTPDKALVKKRFSRSLNTYSEAAEIQRQMAEKLTGMIVRQRTRFNRVLEIGAGTGILTDLLDEKITWKQRIVNDLAEDCAPFHAQRLNTVFLPGDAETQNWDGGPFDLICSNAAFQWLADLPVFFKKLSKVLAPDGLLSFSTFGPDNLKELRALTGQGLRYYSTKQIEVWLKEENFTILSRVEEHHMRRFSDPVEILHNLRKTGVTASGGQSGWWTPGKLASFRLDYRQRFTLPDGKVYLTWNPVYLIAKGAGK